MSTGIRRRIPSLAITDGASTIPENLEQENTSGPNILMARESVDLNT